MAKTKTRARDKQDGKQKASAKKKQRLSHIDAQGKATMVDVGAKPFTERVAVAEAVIRMKAGTLAMITSGKAAKGDVLAVARVAGIQGAKRTSELIPLCHPIVLTRVAIDFEPLSKTKLQVRATARCTERTGVEMEALCAVTTAALTVYDMVKAVDRGMTIEGVGLQEKMGGKSGHWTRKK